MTVQWARWVVIAVFFMGTALVSANTLVAGPVDLPVGAVGTDRTERLASLRRNPDRRWVDRLRGYQVLIASGVFSERLDVHRGERDWLTSEGIDHQLIPLVGAEHYIQNAFHIVEAVRASTKPVIVFSHSKGAMDVLEAFLQLPEVMSQVKGWYSLQGAIVGSPVATAASNPWASVIAREILAWTQGEPETLDHLAPMARVEYLNSRLPRIEAVSRQTAVLSIGAYASTGELEWPLMALRLWKGKEIFGESPNDGVLNLNAQFLPGSDYAVVSGLSHLGSDVALFRAALSHLVMEIENRDVFEPPRPSGR